MRDEFVSVKPVIVQDAPDAHQVWLDIGCQHFTVGDYCETKDEAEWLANQLRTAISNMQAALSAQDGEAVAVICSSPVISHHGFSMIVECNEKLPTGTRLFTRPAAVASDDASNGMALDMLIGIKENLQSLAKGGPYAAPEYIRTINHMASRIEKFTEKPKVSNVTPELRAEAEQLIKQAVKDVQSMNDAANVPLQIDNKLY